LAQLLLAPAFWFTNSRTEELAEWQRAQSTDHAGLEVKKNSAGHVFAA
jgi:hypothetical protein